jgi:hypothetical protein
MRPAPATRRILIAGALTIWLGRWAYAQPAEASLFAGNKDSSDITVYTVAPNGALDEIAGSLFASAPQVRAMALSHDGTLLVTLHDSSQTNEFSIRCYGTGAGGELSELSGSPLVFTHPLALPKDLVVVQRQDREFALALVGPEARIYVLEIEGAPGRQTLVPVPGSPFVTGGVVIFGALAATPDGHYVYVGHYTGQLLGYEIGLDGQLTLLPGSPFAFAQRPDGMAVTPDGLQLYVSNDSDPPVLLGFDVQPGGALVAMSGTGFAVSEQPNDLVKSLAVTPDGQFLYASLAVSDTVTALSRGPGGTLSVIAGSSFAIGPHVAEVVCSNELLFATDDTDSPVFPGSMGVYSFQIHADGTFAALDGCPFAAGDGPTALALWNPQSLPGDLDHDGIVGIVDLLTLLAEWGACPSQCPPGCAADLDGDCTVSIVDFLILLSNWT